ARGGGGPRPASGPHIRLRAPSQRAPARRDAGKQSNRIWESRGRLPPPLTLPTRGRETLTLRPWRRLQRSIPEDDDGAPLPLVGRVRGGGIFHMRLPWGTCAPQGN